MSGPQPTGPSPIKAWEVAYKAGALIAVPTIACVIGLLVRTSTIEGNRFTDGDASSLENRMRVWVETRYPPDWLQRDMSRIASETALIPGIKAAVETLERRVKALEDRGQ